MMTYKEIKDLIKLIDDSNLSEFKMENDNFKITVRTKEYVTGKSTTIIRQPDMMMAAAPVAAVNAAPVAASVVVEKNPEVEYLEIKSPIVGTFYRSPSPDKPPYFKVGDMVNEGDVVCIVEAMKLFNDIESEVSGKIVKVVVEDASPVEYDQVLYLVDPNG